VSRPALADLDWPATTPRLSLRPATAEDVAAMWTWRGRPDVAQWMTDPSRDRDAYLARLTAPEKLATILAVEHEGVVVMDMHVRVEDAYAQTDVADRARGTQANLGWSMDPRVHGRGLATEALNATLGICFDGLGLRRVTGDCFAGNTASWRLMERVGMRRETHSVEEALHRDLGWVDSFTYAILDREWRSRHHPEESP